jgi:PBSX family phage terminase large subunit
MTYQIQAGEGIKDAIYTPRGGCKDFLYCKEPEYIAAGPAETGKTLAACWKMHLLSLKYPGLNGAIIRKTQKSLYGSVLQTWERVIKDAPVTPYGGEKPEKYLYNNGSTIWVGGMDNSDKVLSSERDFFFVNQAEELTLDDWEKLTTRTTGRGAVMPYTMTFGDCNPSGSHHWIRTRPTLKLIHTTHRDNPTLYDDAGQLTEHGKRAMDALSSLSGVRRKRLYEGIWATSEGAVYDMFDAAVHVKERDDKEFVSWGLAMDAGYTHPAVILLIGIDGDGRWHVAREFYERGKLQEDVVKVAKEWYLEKQCNLVAVDAAAAGLIADLNNNSVTARGGKGKVFSGITMIQDRLKLQGDGLPRLSVSPSCVNVINEFESYVWKPEKDEPIKENDHAMDAIRYFGDVMGFTHDAKSLVDFS